MAWVVLYVVRKIFFNREVQDGLSREWKLTTVDPQERSTWRSGVRSAMRAASQLPGKGPTDVDDVAMCTALACRAPCSMPVKLGHLPRRACSACNAMIGP